MIRLAITAEAFEATFPLGRVAYKAEVSERGERYVWRTGDTVLQLYTLRI